MKKGSDGDHQTSNEENLEAVDVSVIDLDDHDPMGTIQVRKVQDHSELEDLLHLPNRLPDPWSGTIDTWLKGIYRGSRDFELGTLNSSLLAITMKSQSMKWKSLALGYIADVVTMAHSFVVDLLNVVCPVEHVRMGIMPLLMDQLVEKYKSAISHVDFLLGVGLAGTPATLNHYFNDNLEKW